MPHGVVDMAENPPPQSTQETVPGTRKRNYRLVLFLICLFISFGFYWRSGEPQVATSGNTHNELEGKEVFQVRSPYVPCTKKLNWPSI